MILEKLNQCITDMDKIKELEEASKDIQKQEKTDREFKDAVVELIKIVDAIQKGYIGISFRISANEQHKLLILVEKCSEAIENKQIREAVVEYVRRELGLLKKEILREWEKRYSEYTVKKINMLHNVRGIAPNQDKVTFVINKIKSGKGWNFKNETFDLMQVGMKEADDIIQNLGLVDEVVNFLNKVSLGSATIYDLKPGVMKWIKEKDMAGKLSINFL